MNKIKQYILDFGEQDTILSKLSGAKDDRARWTFAASSCESFKPNCSLMFAIIYGLIFLIIDVNICQNRAKTKVEGNT